ncbi:MAG: HD domain-containing protein, partial [Solirubrobacterales bacterium]
LTRAPPSPPSFFGGALTPARVFFRRGDTDIEHPVAVAEVLYDNGFTDEDVLAAALLHDVIEDTDTDLSEIGSRFGPEVERLVAEMTENESIEPYAERKAEHRRRVARDGCVSAIYAADKLATSRELRAEHAGTEGERLDHYLKTLEVMRETHPELPFLLELRRELEQLAGRTVGARRSYA